MRKIVTVGAVLTALAAACALTGCGIIQPTIDYSKTLPNASTGATPTAAATATAPSKRPSRPAVWNEDVLGTPIDIYDSTATPGRVQIPVDASVTWVNHDSFTHNISIDSWNLSSGVDIPPGGQYSVRFPVSGTYHFHDGIYPVMGGDVIVK